MQRKKKDYNISARAKAWATKSTTWSNGLLTYIPRHREHDPFRLWQTKIVKVVTVLMREAYQRGYDAGYRESTKKNDYAYNVKDIPSAGLLIPPMREKG